MSPKQPSPTTSRACWAANCLTTNSSWGVMYGRCANWRFQIRCQSSLIWTIFGIATQKKRTWSWALLKERAAKSIAHRLVRQQLQRFSGAFTVSEQDRRDVTGLPTAFLPNVPMHSQANPTPVPDNKNLVFVGSLWYRPNKDGIDWFLKHVWPQVHAQEPSATLTLAGAAPPTLRAQWETHAGVSAQGVCPRSGRPLPKRKPGCSTSSIGWRHQHQSA